MIKSDMLNAFGASRSSSIKTSAGLPVRHLISANFIKSYGGIWALVKKKSNGSQNGGQKETDIAAYLFRNPGDEDKKGTGRRCVRCCPLHLHWNRGRGYEREGENWFMSSLNWAVGEEGGGSGGDGVAAAAGVSLFSLSIASGSESGV